MGESLPEGVSKSARSAFNGAGYAFQDAVAKRTGEIFTQESLEWAFEAAEFPVSTSTRSSRIDLILSHATGSAYVVVECKRVYKSTGWCFARMEHVRRDYDEREVLLSEVRLSRSPSALYYNVHVQGFASAEPVYHIGMPFKLKVPREDAGGNEGGHRQAVEDALSQCMVGVNGLVNAMGRTYSLMGSSKQALIIPVVCTSAQLFSLPEVLSAASLATGRLVEEAEIEERDWLWTRYTQGPDILHEAVLASSEVQKRAGNTLSRELDNKYARAIAIVTPVGLGGFLADCSRLVREWEERTS